MPAGTKTGMSAAILLILSQGLFAADPLAGLKENNPWYPDQSFPKLMTPQWVGEEGVDAVVILGIDDMRNSAQYEHFCRPILQRLKQIDGRAPFSIMTCQARPDDPLLQTWLDEGVSLEVHTTDHPCPLFSNGNLARARSTYDRCVDQMSEIPRNRPVTFRTPCCDSLNTLSPRFFDAIFDRTTSQGNFLQADSSVFNYFTADDPEIPAELVTRPDGEPRFLRYIPKNLKRGDRVFNSHTNILKNYPYPYLINGICWEFPCTAPSDWAAQYLQRPNNPETVRDWEAALDITVLKQGVMCLVFHPHNWIRPEQIVEFIDSAKTRHGKKVKFLSFAEAMQRINEHLLDGHPVRDETGRDNGVRLIDVNRDGLLDVVIASENQRTTRVWQPASQTWKEFPLPSACNDSKPGQPLIDQIVFGTSPVTGDIVMIAGTEHLQAFRFTESGWEPDRGLQAFLDEHRNAPDAAGSSDDVDLSAVTFRDVDGDGRDEIFLTWCSARDDKKKNISTRVYRWLPTSNQWERSLVEFPETIQFALAEDEQPTPLRFVQLDESGLDIVYADHQRTACFLVDWFGNGKLTPLLQTSNPDERLPPIIREDGSDNGFFVFNQQLCWLNEDTDGFADFLNRRSFADLTGVAPQQQVSDQMPPPLTPMQSIAALKTRPDLRIELVAAEPLISDPVAIDWGTDGKLWVVEMGDYPNGIAVDPSQQKLVDSQGEASGAKIRPGGRVKFLEDTDNDGRYDKATLFLDGLSFPTGIQCWRDGVLITCAPDILYAADTDGDGTADLRRTLYQGFGKGNQQHRVNGLRWGLDNWIHVANGDSGGKIRSVAGVLEATPEASQTDRVITRGVNASSIGETIDISGRDLRIQPDQGLIDPVAGPTQFGRNRDDWGNWFGCNNSNPMFFFPHNDAYLRRTPGLGVHSSREPVPEIAGAAPVYPRSQTLARFNDLDRANRFTSACSAMVYRDDFLGDRYAGNAFVCEPVHNLVSRSILNQTNGVFHSHRTEDEQDSEFLASTDNWFRPVMVRTGPEGGLWVVDMYRLVIEHPQWIPPEWQARLNLHAGDDRGRIYRILPASPSPSDLRKNDVAILGQEEATNRSWRDLTVDQLIGMLQSPNGWQRDTAHRILMHRQDAEAIPQLESLVTGAHDPRTRLQALCALHGMRAIRPEIILSALADAHPGVRRHAVRLSEPLAVSNSRVLDVLLTLVDDEDAFVRRQLAYSLGALPADSNSGDAKRIGHALVQLILNSADDHSLRTAAFSSLNDQNAPTVLEVVTSRDGLNRFDSEWVADLVGITAGMVTADLQIRALNRLAEGSPAPEITMTRFEVAARLIDAVSDAMGESEDLNTALHRLLEEAQQVLRDEQAPLNSRLAAINLISSAAKKGLAETDAFAQLLTPNTNPDVQAAAVSGWSNANPKSVPQWLFDRWPAYTPQLRQRIVRALLQRPEWTRSLLQALSQKVVSVNDIDAAGRELLINHSDNEIRNIATQALAVPRSTSRNEILQKYASALTLSGNASSGRKLFEKHCATCHQLDGIGRQVGADLSALTDKSPQALLTAILDPNRAVEAKYRTYVAMTEDGRIFSGMLTSETANSIVLIGTDGKEQLLLRQDIEDLRCTEKSLMPEGLEAQLTPQNISDIIAFVRSGLSSPKRFYENTPQVVHPGPDRSITLLASHASIYGPSLIFESKYRNLGYWQSELDYATWTVDVPEPGRYVVDLRYACDDAAAGGTLQLTAAGETLRLSITGTGSWDRYREVRIGSISLPAGKTLVTVRSTGEIKAALLDLHLLRLTPED